MISKALVERSVAFDGFDVFVIGRCDRASTDMMMPLAPLLYKSVAVGEYSREPAFQLDNQSAQALMDALWSAGLRPSSGDLAGGTGMAAAMKAMQAHIDDLRLVAQLAPTADRPKTAGTY